jgi:iron complex outermembrane receptor protein
MAQQQSHLEVKLAYLLVPKMTKRFLKRSCFLFALQMAIVSPILAADSLDVLSLEELTKTEITSVSRKSQNLANVPAAAFVISSEDIRRSGAQTIPDVLRMAPGIEVAQIDNGRYAVTARGFNGRFANKLQVLVDGRSIYLPTFSGVMWERDPVALEDIERIEVIRGAGAAVWGVNAVSGVINIISKHTREQVGGLIAPVLGTDGKGGFYARYGASLDEDTSWKLSAQGRHAEPSKEAASGAYAEDRLNNVAVDMRFDKKFGGGSDLALWANAMNSSLGDSTTLDLSNLSSVKLIPVTSKQITASQTIAGRYRWLTSAGIESSLQMSATASSIEIAGFFKEDRNTYDIDYQGRYTFSAHDVLWGLSHRSTSDSVSSNALILKFAPSDFTQRTTGFFLQDEWTLIPDTLQLGVGARWDYTNLGGNTFAPNATLMWTPSRSNTLWAKYAQAPRMPSRAEQNVTILNTVISAQASSPIPVVLRTSGNGSLTAEKMEGVELGYRSQLTSSFNVDLTAYRYRYTDIVGGKTGSQDFMYFPVSIIQNVSLGNLGSGWINGAELASDWLITPTWRVQLSYTWTRIDMDDSNNPQVQGAGKNAEVGTPHHYGSIRSQWNISAKQQFDAWVRGSAGYDRVNAPYVNLVRVPGYVTLDLRYAHKVNKDLELAITGRNLVGANRTEFVSDYIPSVPVEIVPSLLLSARWKF